MSGGYAQVERVRLQKSTTAQTVTAPTSPVKQGLSTAATSDTSQGTAVSGGSYAPQSTTYGTPSSANPSVVSNTAANTFTNMPTTTTTDMVDLDSAGTPVFLHWGPLSASKATTLGDTLVFAIGAIQLSF